MIIRTQTGKTVDTVFDRATAAINRTIDDQQGCAETVIAYIDVIERIEEKANLEPSPNPKARTTKEERVEQDAWCRGWRAAMHVIRQAFQEEK